MEVSSYPVDLLKPSEPCRIVERQPIVFGQPPEWYTKFEEIRDQRRKDRQMPPCNKLVNDILNKEEETISVEDKDEMVPLRRGS